MSAYPELLDNMMDAILKRDLTPAKSLYRDKKDFPVQEQLAVYVEGYRIRLYEGIEGAYPALLYYLGKPAFRKLAEAFIEATPSRYFNIDKYSIAFGEYVKKSSKEPFAGELALLESAIHEVYQLEETPALKADWIEQQTPESLAESVLYLRGASRLLAFTYPVNDYLTKFREDKNPAKPAPSQSYLLVLRHKNQVRRLPLAEAEYALLATFAVGKTITKALEDGRFTPYAEDENLSAELMNWFAHWVKEGCLRSE